MGAACMKSHIGPRSAAEAACPPTAAEKAAEAASEAAIHSGKPEEAEEAAAAAAEAPGAAVAAPAAAAPAAASKPPPAAEAPAAAAEKEAEAGSEPKEAKEKTETGDQQTTTPPQQTQAAAAEATPAPVVALTEADTELLAAAQQQAAAAAAAAANTPHAYLVYSSDLNEGSLFMQWVPNEMKEEEIQSKKYIILAYFTPAKHRTVPKSKFSQNGGITYLLQEMKYKWEIWNKQQRQLYFCGWTKFLKAADEAEGFLCLRRPDHPAPPARVALLHTGPAGANITPKRFGEIATTAGGAYVQLSRRGGDAAFDEAEVVRWLAEDGLEIKKKENGIKLDDKGYYEKRSEKKGGNAAEQ